MRPDTLGVIGLGAIGGSVAWQASRAGVRVLGYARARADGVAALRQGALHEVVQRPRDLFRRADLVVLAAPPIATLDLLRQHCDDALRAGRFLTDVTSVKQPVVRLASDLGLGERFAGSHPFAGTHHRGFAGARPDRFRGAVVYITPAGDEDTPVREIADFWSGVLEARSVVVDAALHDELLAWTSHLPQAVASALAATLAEWGPRGVTYGAGARDTTRLAAGSVELWRDVLLLNRQAVLQALDRVDDATGALRRALTEGDGDALARWLERGRRWREGLDA